MHVINARNVSEALPLGMMYLLNRGRTEESRAGPVIVAPGPVTTCYTHPRERVLTSSVRDANPFFHLAEIAWMLAGRDDATLLNNFVSDFGQRFAESASGKSNAEDDGRVHGAYGKRWRREFGLDQLDHVVETLKKNPESRQMVIQMWDCRPRQRRVLKMNGEDMVITNGCNDLRGEWLDRPCNTHLYLRLREIVMTQAELDSVGPERVLDMTVCCRSNDIIWGAYGANAIHFSALQEYLAARIGVEVGHYYQVSNNFHAYTAEVDRLLERSRAQNFSDVVSGLAGFPYRHAPMPMVDNPELFDQNLREVLRWYETHDTRGHELENRWLYETLHRALSAHRLWKTAQKYTAIETAKTIACPDWRKACVEWMERRKK